MAKDVTLTSMRTLVRQMADIVNNNVCTDAEINSYLNLELDELYDLLIDTYEDYFISSSSISIVSGTASYAIPSDFYKIRGVDIIISASESFSLRAFQFEERNQYGTGDAKSLRYQLRGSLLHFIPSPTVTVTGTLWYIPARTDTASGGSFDSINGWHDYAIAGAAIRCNNKQETDVSWLIKQKNDIKERVLSLASKRDVGSPRRVVDVTQRYDASFRY